MFDFTLYVYVVFDVFFFQYLFNVDRNLFVDTCFRLCDVLKYLRILFLSLNFVSLNVFQCVEPVIKPYCVIVWKFHDIYHFCFLRFYTWVVNVCIVFFFRSYFSDLVSLYIDSDFHVCLYPWFLMCCCSFCRVISFFFLVIRPLHL